MTASENPVSRRLAAIVAADVAGYSRLMGADEAGTLRLLTERREMMDELIARHGGRIANTAGDSVLADFNSVFAAVECAVAVQRAHAEQNARLPPERRVSFRIGVHLGDVMVKGGDLFGDGVNTAARLQDVAEPGGIALSGKAHEEVAGKLQMPMDDTGDHRLRNIARPVRVWRVRLDQAVRAAAAPKPRKGLLDRIGWRMGAAAAAAMFALGGAAGAAYFWLSGGAGAGLTTYYLTPFAATSDAGAAKPLAGLLTARLVTGLGNIPYIRVAVPTSRNQPAPPSSARYAIGGTVTPGSAKTTVEAHITEIATGRVVATAKFDAPPRELSDMQDEILGQLGEDLSVEINKLRFPFAIDTPERREARTLAEEARLRTDLRSNPQRAIELFDKAAALSPDDIDIIGWRANNLIAIGTLQPTESPERKTHLDRARQILAPHKDKVQFHRLLSYAHCQLLNYSGELQAALVACEETKRLLPWSARVEKEIGSVLMKLGLLERSLAASTQADRLGPSRRIGWVWQANAGLVCLLLDRNQEAAAWLTKAAALRPDQPGIQALFAVALHRTENGNGLRQQMAALNRMAAYRQHEVQVALPQYYATFEFANPSLQPKLAVIAREFDEILKAEN